MQTTLVLLKPDAVKKQLVETITARLDSRFMAIKSKPIIMTRELAEKHYAHLTELANFDEIIDFMISGQMIALIYSGDNVIQEIRKMIGPAFNAPAGTIRGDYGAHKHANLIHASDSEISASAEINRFFPELSPKK